MPTKNILIILSVIFSTLAFAQSKVPSYPVDSSYTIEGQYKKYKKQFPEIVPVKDSLPAGIIANRDLIYTTLENTPYGKRELHLDVFSPEKTGHYPTIVLIHGGGWQAGNKNMLIPMAQLLAAKGYTTITVEYQLGLEAKYPAAVYNIKSALRWMHANADTYKIDTAKIAILGCSSGGHLANLVGLTNGVKQFEGDQGNLGYSSSVKAIIDIDGLVNFLAPLSLNKERKPDATDVNWLGGTYTEKPEIWKEASPIYWANKNSVPILFLNSGYPRFHAGQDELIGLYKEWGIYYEVHKFDVKMHTFWHFHPYVDQTVNYITEFLDKTLK